MRFANSLHILRNPYGGEIPAKSITHHAEKTFNVICAAGSWVLWSSLLVESSPPFTSFDIGDYCH